MKGESKGSQQPVNSLLDTVADVRSCDKLAPITTVKYTTSIEGMINQRILADDWYDAIPRELPDIGPSRWNSEPPEIGQLFMNEHI